MELKDPELTRSQDRNLEFMKRHTRDLLINFSKLLETTMIGHPVVTSAPGGDDPENEEESDSTKKTPAEISSLSYTELKASVMRQKYQAAVYSHAIVHAAENLLKLVDGLKLARLLHDADQIGSSVQELSKTFDHQSNLAQIQFEQLSDRLLEAHNENDSKKLSSSQKVIK